MELMMGFILIALITIAIEIYTIGIEIGTELERIATQIKPTYHPVELLGVTIGSERNLADELLSAIQSVVKAVEKSN